MQRLIEQFTTMIITTTHASLINGKIYEAPANTITEILKNKKQNFIFIRHSIDGQLASIIYYYREGHLIGQKKLSVISKISLFRYISEIIMTFFYFLSRNNKDNVYIGVDPLNCITGVLLKKIGRLKRVIFYAVDYSKKRFENKLLNSIYHLVDGFCARRADQVWNVSSRIYKVRKGMDVSTKKNILIPNIPSDEYKKYSGNLKEKYHLITLGIIGEQLDYIGIFEAVKELKTQYPQIMLKIVGNGPKEEEYKTYVENNNLNENIKFLGYLSHDQALNQISRSGIGLALYNGNWSFNYYGDSMKCREYFCFGLPVITTDTHATVEEIKEYQSGIVCKIDKKEYVNAILEVFKNYDQFSKNSYSLSKKYADIHTKLLESL